MHSVRGRVEKNGTNAIFKETMRTFQNNEKQNPTDSEFQQTPSRDKYTETTSGHIIEKLLKILNADTEKLQNYFQRSSSETNS